MTAPDLASLLIDRRIRGFADYWIGLYRGGGIPDRRAIDPVEIPWTLPFIWICDYLQDRRDFRYRLAGEHINDAFRRNLKGRTMSEIVAPEVHANAIRRYAGVIETPALVHNIGPVYNHRGETLVGERIVFPLSSGGGRIDMIIGVTVSKLNPARAGGVHSHTGVPDTYVPLSSLA
ncbi:PAS domain-containing protein [Arenibaculum pallidiluteum]|uniref:PAS domain-containing protein n=1 Tax=Arenibaculum pallidiluteum TaxID=2812559 RepID=UPI001A9580DF|nr:PAS domain-containing protein [Arenibaculum pallidiluteum]